MSAKVRWSWMALLFLALAVRLVALDSAPLTSAELTLAVPAWDAARGLWPATTDSPLLLMGNALLFWLFGPGDGIARLLPALAGIALVALPLLWRDRLGEAGALVTAGLLAFSPVSLHAARTLDGATLGLLAAGLLFTGGVRQDRAARWLQTSGIALGLVSGPIFYDALLVGVLAWLTYRWARGERRWPNFAPSGQPAAFGVAAALVLATGCGLRWSGWAGPVEPLLAWFGQWRGASGGAGLTLLAAYEPATLFMAAVMLGWAVVIMEPWLLGLGFATLLGLLTLTLRPGAPPLALLAIVAPLALLGGALAQRLWAQRRTYTLLGEGMHVPLAFLFWIFAGLALARHTSYLNTGIELLLALLVLLIQCFLIGTFAMFVARVSAWRGALLGTVAFLLVLQLGFAWGTTFTRRTTSAEPLVGVVTSPDIRNLRVGVAELQRQRGIGDDVLLIAVIDADPDLTPTLRWALRDLPHLTVVSSWTADVPAFVVAPEWVTPLASPARAWQRSAFTAHLRPGAAVPGCTSLWPPLCSDLVRWYLYRALPAPPHSQRIILWLAP